MFPHWRPRSWDEQGARKVYGQGLWFSFIAIVAIAVVIFIFAGPIAGLLGATPDLFDSIVLFIRIFMFGYPFCIIGHIAVYMARVDEKPSIATWAMTLSAILALVWLYASVFILKLGIAGCAGYYASSIGIWGFFILYFFFSKNIFSNSLSIHDFFKFMFFNHSIYTRTPKRFQCSYRTYVPPALPEFFGYAP